MEAIKRLISGGPATEKQAARGLPGWPMAGGGGCQVGPHSTWDRRWGIRAAAEPHGGLLGRRVVVGSCRHVHVCGSHGPAACPGQDWGALT